jgi:DNA repair exonuclease SbcCD nuclease subunit
VVALVPNPGAGNEGATVDCEEVGERPDLRPLVEAIGGNPIILDLTSEKDGVPLPTGEKVFRSLTGFMKVNFIHSADWQVGKPFAGVEDPNKRAALQNERVAVIKRLAKIASEYRAEFVLVAGDLFDSPHATKSTVAAACSAIGAIGIPVFAIPGNHDHGGAGSLWEQEFFQREREQLSPNLKILLKSEPVELENAVLFPCPLLRRQEVSDPTAWLRASQDFDTRFGNKSRIALAHGTVLDFGAPPDDEESGSGTANLIDLQRLPVSAFDYIALGDWHGTKQVAANAWYSGTPELDRFVKGEDHNPGNVLVVEAGRAEPPRVQCVKTGAIGWHEIDFSIPDDTGLDRLKELVDERIGSRANEDLLRLQLSGSLGIEAATRLEQLIEAWNARLIRVKLDNQTAIAPSPTELDGLTHRASDPLISRVAAKLVVLASGAGEEAAVARVALRELYAACNAH